LIAQLIDDGTEEEVPAEEVPIFQIVESDKGGESRQVRTQTAPVIGTANQASTNNGALLPEANITPNAQLMHSELLSPQELLDADVQMETGGEMMERLQQALAWRR
jgi:hypothetical protein